MKELSPLVLAGRFPARFAAASGVIALLVWVTWVMLDLRHLQSGFTLPGTPVQHGFPPPESHPGAMPFVPSPRSLPGLIAGTLTSLLVLTGAARAQTPPSVLKEPDPPVQVCLTSMPDNSGSDGVMAMVFTPDGRHLLVGCKSGAVELRSVEGGLVFRRQAGTDVVASVAASPDGSLLVSASGRMLHLWSGTGEPRGSFHAEGCDDCAINAVVVSPDGGSLLSGHDDASATLWSLKGVQLRRFEDPRPFVSSGYRVVRLAFGRAGQDIAIGHENGTVRRCSASGQLLGEIDTGIQPLKALDFLPSGDLVVAGWYGAERWDAQGRQQGPLRVEGAIDALQLLPDGSAAVLAGVEGNDFLEMRDLHGRVLLTFQDHFNLGNPGETLPDGPLAISPDGKVLVVADGDRLHRWPLPPARGASTGAASAGRSGG